MNAYIKGYLKKEADQAGSRPGYFSKSTWREFFRGLLGMGQSKPGAVALRNKSVDEAL